MVAPPDVSTPLYSSLDPSGACSLEPASPLLRERGTRPVCTQLDPLPPIYCNSYSRCPTCGTLAHHKATDLAIVSQLAPPRIRPEEVLVHGWVSEARCRGIAGIRSTGPAHDQNATRKPDRTLYVPIAPALRVSALNPARVKLALRRTCKRCRTIVHEPRMLGGSGAAPIPLLEMVCWTFGACQFCTD